MIYALPMLDIPKSIESIQLSGTIDDSENTFDFNLMVKGQDKIKASIKVHNAKSQFEIIYNNDELRVRKDRESGSETTTLYGDKAATNLLDLMALNPLYHFKESDDFKLTNSVFKNFELVYENLKEPDESTKTTIPKSIKLYRIESNSRTLIRTIEYKDFHANKEGFAQPKEIILIDEASGNRGRIIVHHFEYNKGIPNFIFN